MAEQVTSFNELTPRRQKTVKELIGKKYGMLTVESFAYAKGTNNYMNCLCDCGNHAVKRMSYLTTGHTTSCGCLVSAEKNDLTGRTYGYWTVLGHDESRTTGGIFYICRCVCGTERSIEKKRLVYGRTKSCGCRMQHNRKETLISKGSMAANSTFEDITGERFGRLTVIERSERTQTSRNNDRKYVFWRCRCDCGNETEVITSHLTSGKVVSCGCYQKEMVQVMAETKGILSGAVDGTNVNHIRSALEGKVTKANHSGIRGVSKVKNGFVARIGFKGKDYYLGQYKTLGEAEKVRKKAEQAIFGEWLENFEENMRDDYESEREKQYQQVVRKLRELKNEAKADCGSEHERSED